jgi:hypothetical protein
MKIFIIVFILAFACVEVIAQTSTTDSLVVNVSNASLNQDNSSVSINRKNKNPIVIGAASDYVDMDNNGISAYTSTDTGKTWNIFRLPLPSDQLFNSGPPSLASDNAGNFYYAYITNDDADSAGSIAIATSTDGKIWKNATYIDNNPAPDHYGFPDGVFLTVDNSIHSSHYGRVYAVWDQFYSDLSLILEQGAYIAWSDNQCKTWTKPKFLGSSDDYQMVRTGKNGEIFVAISDSSSLSQQLYLSTDGGSTFVAPISLSRLLFHYPFYSTGLNTGYSVLKGSQGFAAAPYNSLDIDINNNRIYWIYGNYEADVASLHYEFSDNLGMNWSTQQIIGINLLDSADRFDPCVSIDQTTGDAFVLYYSSESDKKNVLVAPYRLRLSDVLPDQPQILSPSFNPLIVEKSSSSAPYIGDRISSDAFGGVYVGSWTQNRAGFVDGDVFAYVSITSSKNSVMTPIMIHSHKLWLSPVFPNPSQGKKVSTSYYLPHSTNITFDLYDESGRRAKHLADKQVQEGSYTEEFTLDNLAPGSYVIRMVTEDDIVSQKFVVIGK